jgi:PAS domain S-box-containing protein
VDAVTADADCVVVLDAPATAGVAGVDGVAEMARIRDRLSVPVVVYTTREGIDPVVRALAAGAADVIRMPARHDEAIAVRVRRAAGTGGEFQPAAAQIRSLLHNYPHTLYLKDEYGRFANATTHAAGNYGLTREQMVGLTDYELFDRELADELYAEERAIVETGEPIIRKVESYVDEAGARRWAMTTKVPRHDADGRIVGIVGGTRDVTAAKRQEEMMAALHHASRDLSEATTRDDIAGVAVEIANEVSLFTGVELSLCGSGDDEMITVASGAGGPVASQSEAVKRAIETGRTQYVDTDGVVTDDQSTVVASAFVGRPFDEEVGIVVPLGEHGAICLGIDDGVFDQFTNRLSEVLAANVTAALDRSERERELARKNRQLEEFSTIGAHELRNRLQIVLAAIVHERADRDSERLAGAESTLERMDRLLTQLLRLARTGEIPRTTEAVDLRECVERAWEGVADTGTVTLRPPPSTVIEANPDALTELFDFLIRNAVEHAGDEVTLEVGLLPDGFYVADDGVGIPADLQSELFDVRYADAVDETGYGLYIVGAIVDAHGWDVTAADSDTGGARFEITGVTTP